jgi:hypothetical protein
MGPCEFIKVKMYNLLDRDTTNRDSDYPTKLYVIQFVYIVRNCSISVYIFPQEA